MVTCRFKIMNSNQSGYQATFTRKYSFKKSLCLSIATFVSLKLDRNTSETHPLLLCGICSILIFEILNWLVLLKNKASNCTKLYQETNYTKSYLVCLMSAILMELNSVQDYDLRLVICVYINLGIIFKTL